MNTFGNKFKISIFGESHGEAVGVVIDGVPAGIRLDYDFIESEMQRRAPGNAEYSTPRKEADIPEIISGVNDHVTTGFPITCVIKNTNTRSSDYSKVLRPSHADWTALIKYNGKADMRGGGHFSGRLTAGLVFAGAIAKQIMDEKGVEIIGRIKSIGNITDDIDLTSQGNLDKSTLEDLKEISQKKFAALDGYTEMFLKEIAKAKEEKDSIGGVIETVVLGLPAGIGEPFFDSIESRIAAVLFSIPAVKGVEFGKGFEIAKMKGSEANDPIALTKEKNIVSVTNNNGGILGGISNGMPIIVSAAVKPTASIGIAQKTVDPETMQETTLTIEGRHDPCIVPRAVSVIEAGIAIVLLDFLMESDCEF